MARPLIFLHVFCIGGILATSITHGFTRRRPVRSLQIPPESGICPTDLHRFFVGDFGHADFADDADFFIGYFYSSDFTELIRRFLAMSITHGFTRRRPVRSLQIPPESGICPTDLHRFFVGDFGHADFADDADFFIGYFYSSDFTELIRRFLAMSITHGFTRRRPVRSLQIPPESGICPTDFTDIHRFFVLQFPSLPSLSSILISHFSFLISHFIIPFYFFTFLPFYFFTF